MSTTSAIKTILFDPLLPSLVEVRAFLRTKYAGTAHPFERVLHIWNGKTFDKLDLSDKPDEYFLDDTQLNALGGILGERMQRHEAALHDVLSYEIVTSTNPMLEISHTPGKIMLFALSLSNQPSYYDIMAMNTSADVVCYNATKNGSIPCLVHSGDLVGTGSVLLHTLTPGHELSDAAFAVGLSGYQGNALHRYKAQNPAVLLVDHEARVMYLVPVPLDKATIEDATLCFPLVGQRMRTTGTIRFAILSNATTQTGAFANGANLTAARTAVRLGVQAATDMFATGEKALRVRNASKGQKPDTTAPATTRPRFAAQNQPIRDVVIAAEDDVPIHPTLAALDRDIIRFGLGISVVKSGAPTHAHPPCVFPCFLGNVIEGGKILALARPFRGETAATERLLSSFEAGSVPVVFVSDHMTDQCRMLNPNERINGLFIVRPFAKYHKSILDSPVEREAFLKNVTVNAITALAGPQSIVVVELEGNFFFYRGIRWPGIFEAVPDFGMDVTESIVALLRDVSRLKEAAFVWPTRITLSTAAGAAAVYLGDQVVKIDDIATIFEAMSLKTLVAMRSAIQDVLTQLQGTLGSNDVNKVSCTLITILKKKFSDAASGLREPYIQAVLRFLALERSQDTAERDAAELHKNRLHSDLRGTEKEAKDATQWLIDGLGRLVSSRASSTMTHDLNQILKKTTIAGNVADAKNLGVDDLLRIVADNCGKVGVVLGNVDTDMLRAALLAAAEDNFLDASQKRPLSTGKLMTASGVRGTAELSALLPVVSNVHHGPLKAKEGVAWALPQLSPVSDMAKSAIPWPCFDRYVNLKDPSDMYWPEESMNNKDVAAVRIVIRGTLAAASMNLNTAVLPQSRHLGFLLIVGLLDLVEDMANARMAGDDRRGQICDAHADGSPTPSSPAFADSFAQAVRGLFGQLFTLMASGAGKPLSLAWQLVMKNPKLEVPPADEMTIYSRVVSLLPTTLWPMRHVKRNVYLLLVRAIRVNITDPVTSPMRKAVNAMKQTENLNHLKRRNQELGFLQIAVEVIRHLCATTVDDDNANARRKEVRHVARRVLDRVPSDIIKNGGMAIVVGYFQNLINHGTASEAQERRVIEACANMYMKRAAHFKKAKKAVLKTIRADNREADTLVIVEKMEAEKARIADEFNVKEVKMQNAEAYRDVVATEGRASTETLCKVIGDAEMTRIPWRVLTGEEAPKAEISEAVSVILDCNTSTVRSQADIDRKDAGPLVIAGTVDAVSLESRLRALKNGGKAADLCRDCGKWTAEGWCTAAALPLQAARSFLRCIELDDASRVLNFFKTTADVLLEGWQDPVKAEMDTVASSA
ncbi:hypothetical protein HDU89_001475 [Geranomyces variabilis]|nr:hypothetical protein HDU89_001475 [Geranomyces variabilis]